MTVTVREAIAAHRVDIDPHLERQATIPFIAYPRQGDVIAIPEKVLGQTLAAATTVVPAEGVPVVRGENGGNTHLLLAHDGVVYFDAHQPVDAADNLLGVLFVPEGSTALLAHPQHGYTGILAGTYEMRRQREQQGDAIRQVAD